MTKKLIVKLTANFERNLVDVERFLTKAEAPKAYDALLDELLDTVIPNLERFPDMGRPFLAKPTRSVETTNALEALRFGQHRRITLASAAPASDLRHANLTPLPVMSGFLGPLAHQ